MLLKIQTFGGLCQKILDPSLLGENKSQVAENVRNDQGGIAPLLNDLGLGASVPAGTQSLYAYYEPKSPMTKNYLSWLTDVDAVKSPVPNDLYNRVYYTENGLLKATDKDLFKDGGPPYPAKFYYPSPPAPTVGMTASIPDPTPQRGNLVTDPTKANAGDADPNNPASNAVLTPNQNTFFLSKKGFNDIRKDDDAWWQYDFGVPEPINSLTMWYDDTQNPDVAASNAGPSSFIVQGSNDKDFQDLPANPTAILFQVSGLGIPKKGTWPTDSQWGGIFEPDGLTWTWTNTIGYRYIRIKVTATTDDSKAPPYTGKSLQINCIQMTVLVSAPDETLAQTKVFTYTFVNDFDQEGPPWVPDNIDQQIIKNFYEGNEVTFDLPDTGEDWDALYKLKSKRVYVSNQTASGETILQKFGEYPIIQVDVPPVQLFSTNLGVVCPSEGWSQPPGFPRGIPTGDGPHGKGLYGLISLPGGILAGFSGNLICFSVPNFPHAWPVTQQYAIDSDVIALGAYGTTVVALSQGQPYLAVGNDPANIVVEKIGDALSCMSKRGIVSVNGATVYPCPEGLKAIGPSLDELLTKDLLTEKQWNDNYNPSSIYAYYWDGKYVGFYLTPTGSVASFMLDLKTRDLFTLLAEGPTSGYYDPIIGRLNLVKSGGALSAFNEGTGYKSASYKTKRFKFEQTSFSCIKVIAVDYPVYIDLIYPKIPLTVTVTVTSEKPQRLLSKTLVDTIEVSPYSGKRTTGEVSAIFLASMLDELP